MTQDTPSEEPRSVLWYAWDLPNRYSMVGLVCAALGIYFAILGNFPAAMIGLVWAVAFDWFDGRVARGMKGRTARQREFGEQLDSIIDVISFGVAPAVLLLSAGGFSPWFLPGAFVVLFASTARLAYFNVFGLAEGSTYRGLALDNNMIILVALFALRPVLGASAFAVVLYVALVGLSVLNVSPLRTPKFGGKWYFVILAYAVVMSVFYGGQLLANAG